MLFCNRLRRAERNWPWEKWYGSSEWREASIRRQGGSSYHWFLDQVVVAREDGETRLGHVSRVAVEPDGALSVAIRLWPGRAQVFAVRLVNPNRTEFTVNVLVDAESPAMNTLRQRLYAKRRRRDSVRDHLRVKGILEQMAHRRGKG